MFVRDKGSDGLGIREGVKAVLRRTRSVGTGGLFERLGMMGDSGNKWGKAGCSVKGRLLISRFRLRVRLQYVSFLVAFHEEVAMSSANGR